jgi:uncharacterized damage-inducible protein DinB
MSEKASILKEYAEYVYESLGRTVEGLTEREMGWRPTEVSNNIEWILNHLARISNLSLQRIIKGDPEYKPSGWPDDYADRHHGLEKMLKDIDAGKKAVLEEMGKLSDADLEEEIPLWGGKRKRKTGLFAYLGELMHHRGQIAYLRGTMKRLKEKDPKFLA